MTSKRKQFDPTAPPDRWLNCPRKSEGFIAGRFIAFKTPLSSDFNVPAENRWSMGMLIDSVKSYDGKLGLVIDLTFSTRYYNSDAELKEKEIKYLKIKCSGHDGTPTLEQTKLFIEMCSKYESQNPTSIIGVHCTHGFNRTGFLICAYLVEKYDFSIEAAVNCFSRARQPGIYKQDYINELYKRYADPSDEVIQVTINPTWEEPGQNEDDDEESAAAATGDLNNGTASGGEKMPFKKRKREFIKQDARFVIQISGIEAVVDLNEMQKVQQKVQQLCEWEKSGFPGAQPVSMDVLNVNKLKTEKYRVSWKADGTRYLMYIAGRDFVYMLDRDNSVFHVTNLSFPKFDKPEDNLENTLLDGEFVIDIDQNKVETPRFLIYDIISFEGDKIGYENFDNRIRCIAKQIIECRTRAIETGRINRLSEPFGVRLKHFSQIQSARKLISEEFTKSILHGTDGLIFQPVDEKYTAGQCESILKWKPPSLNSVDFKLNIIHIDRPGFLPEDCEIGQLFVGGYDQQFSTIKINKTLRALNGRIIECKWEGDPKYGCWVFMRERTDKSYPNAYKTAVSVCNSITSPVTEKMLFSIIDSTLNENNKVQNQMMAPPATTKVYK